MNKNVFYCYSPTLKKELVTQVGERFICKGVNPNTNREFWCFLYTPELVKYLDERPKQAKKYRMNEKNPKFDN